MNQNVEHLLITKFRKQLWRPFSKAIRDYELVSENDKIAICISGGKDSFILAKLMQELQRHGNKHFDLVFLCMNPGYEPHILKQIEENAKLLEIPIQIYKSDIFDVSLKLNEHHPCYMCARMRRGALYAKAQELGCNKLALGHHFDDVIETILLNVLCAGNYKTMMPKLHAQNFEGMEIIRPLYLVEEKSIIRWMEYTGLTPLNCACMVAAEKIGNKRHEIKDMIAELKKNFKDVDKSIFKSATNVNMNSILGWEKDGEKYSFLDPENPLE